MKSRLLGNGIDMGLFQPLPPPLPHTQGGGGVESDFHETQCLTFKKKRYPLTSVMLYCNLLLRMYFCYILHYPISGNILCLLNLLKCLLLFTGSNF